jgi:hypothetical protein
VQFALPVFRLEHAGSSVATQTEQRRANQAPPFGAHVTFHVALMFHYVTSRTAKLPFEMVRGH